MNLTADGELEILLNGGRPRLARSMRGENRFSIRTRDKSRTWSGMTVQRKVISL
jgi:hypothetical protein